MTLRMLTDEQRQFDQWQLGQQWLEPQLRTFRAWRQIAAVPSARIAVAHRDNRDLRRIVENICTHAHPVAYTLSTEVIPGNACSVHARAGRLSDDEDTGRRSRLPDWPRSQRQIRFANVLSGGSAGVSTTQPCASIFQP